MASNDVHPDEVESAARALLDERMGSIRALTQSRQQIADRRAALTEAERAHAAAHADALRRGWTQEELKRLGFTETARKARGRPRRSQQTPRLAAPAASPAPATEGETEAHAE